MGNVNFTYGGKRPMVVLNLCILILIMQVSLVAVQQFEKNGNFVQLEFMNICLIFSLKISIQEGKIDVNLLVYL